MLRFKSSRSQLFVGSINQCVLCNLWLNSPPPSIARIACPVVKVSIRVPPGKRTARMNATWKLGVSTGHWAATYRGIRILIKVDPKTGRANEVAWYIEGRLDIRSPLDCDLETAKKIGGAVVDQRIPLDERWLQAETRDRNAPLLRHDRQ